MQNSPLSSNTMIVNYVHMQLYNAKTQDSRCRKLEPCMQCGYSVFRDHALFVDVRWLCMEIAAVQTVF